MRKGDDARRELLCRAAELFDSRGYDAVSIKDIADSLGWPKSLIYYYCSGKEELVMKAAKARADAIIGGLKEYIDANESDGSRVLKLSRALSCVSFWYDANPKTAARLIRTLYQPGSLPWRVYLRAAIIPEISAICNDIIAEGVKEYEMYTPYPREICGALLELTADLAEKLAPLVMQGGGDAFERIESLLAAYRCAIERLVEAPFGSLRLVETEFLRDTARELGVDISGGNCYETPNCDNCSYDDAAPDGACAG